MSKARILVVEDETIIAIEIESYLQKLGYHVTAIVNSGDDAIRAAEAEKPDLILMDIRIKGTKDGIETAEIIRSKLGIPVVFSTAYLDDERINRAKITIPFGYVLKPIQEKDLKVTIEMALYVSKIDTKRKQAEEALEKRIIALTQPALETEKIAFEDLFNLDDIQQIQDKFALATGVASIITHTDGVPITQPSNFCHLCSEIIRKSDQGLRNCIKSDADIGKYHPAGPIIQKCMSGGLWDAGAAITVGGRHLANWLIGQVRDKTQTEDKIRTYAREIKVDEEEAIKAFHDVPAMSFEQFEIVAQALYTLANQLSTIAFQNVQQARFIAERKKAEEALRENQIYLSTLVNTLPNMVWLKDKDGVYLSCNTKFEGLFGAKQAEIIGKTDYDFVDKKQADFFRQKDQEVIESEISTVEEEEVTFAGDGHRELIEKIKTPMYNSNGELIGVLGIAHDITSRKHVEEKLRKAHDELETRVTERTEDLRHEIEERKQIEEYLLEARKEAEFANKAKSTFLSNLSHEFRTPMHQILSYSKFGEDKIYDVKRDKLLHYFSKIRTIGKNLLSLLNNLLDLSKLESGKMDYDMKKCDLRTIIKNVSNEFHSMAEEKEVKLVMTDITSPYKVICDEGKISQVIRNLLSNAIKFTKNGSIVNVSITRINMDSKPHDFLEGIEFRISDQGVGIPINELDSVFDKFVQSSKTKTGSGGTGLGLAICKEIINAHNGKIWAENDIEGGATFHFTLPSDNKIFRE